MMKNILIIVFLIFSLSVKGQNAFLESYITIALENNFGIQSKSQNIQAIASEKEMIKGEATSNFDIMYGYGVSPIETRNGPVNHKVSAGMMLPWFGTRSSQYEVVDYKIEKAQKEKLQTENGVKYTVRNLYFKMLQNKKDLYSSRENIVILKTFEAIALTQYENAKGSLVDVLRVQMQTEEANNKVETLENDSLLLSQQFALVLNQKIEKVEFSDEIIFSQNEESLENNPMLLGLEATQKVIDSEVNTVSKAAAPKIKVGLEYSILGDATMSSENSGQNAVMPMIGLSIPIFNSKKYSGKKEQLSLNHQTVRLQKQELGNVLQAEYLKALNQKEDALRDRKVIEQQMLKVEQAIKIQQEAYIVGNSKGSDFVELLRLQIQKLDYQFKDHQAEMNKLDAFAKVEFLQGQ